MMKLMGENMLRNRIFAAVSEYLFSGYLLITRTKIILQWRNLSDITSTVLSK